MQITLIILFWMSIIAVFHSYLLYPLLLQLFSRNKQPNTLIYNNDSLPFVSVVMSVFNEEKVIRQKIESVFDSNYPLNKIQLVIGSDCSIDRTNEIIEGFQKTYPQITFYPFTTRRGKADVLNELISKCEGDILILTDANVLFSANNIVELVKHFKNEKIGLVGSNIVNYATRKDGISIQEREFISREILIKYREGLIWGTMSGAFGGCFAIRKSLYEPIPKFFTVDDFFLSMKVLEKGLLSIVEMNAVCFEDVPNKVGDEFRRKVRISSGNYQNLTLFYKLLWPPFSGLSFSFLSHKVLRWFGPFFILIAFFSSLFLYPVSPLYKIACLGLVFLFVSPLIDSILKKIGIHIVTLRFVSYFIAMNIAVFIGFVKYLLGNKTHVWQPTNRNNV